MAFLLKVYFEETRNAKRSFLIAQKISLRVNDKLPPWVKKAEVYEITGVRGANKNALSKVDKSIPLPAD